MRAAVGLLLACAFVLGGCGGVKARRITAENKDKLFEQIQHTHDLTVEEVGLLQSYVLRTAMRDAVSGKEPALPVGKTIGQVIDEERAYQKQAASEAKAESLRVARAQAEEARQQEVLRKAVLVTVFGKDQQTSDYQDYMVCKLLIENQSGKDVRGFRGSLVFKNLFGEVIIRLHITEDDVLAAGASRRVTRYWKYNQFVDENVRWANTELANMKIEWAPQTVIFTDGTTLAAGEQ